MPKDLELHGDLAIDTEALGLNLGRDRLCVMQISNGNGEAHLIQFSNGNYNAPNLKSILADPTRVKIMHYARFDIAIIYKNLGLMLENIYCTKIASKIARTYTDSHGLKDLCRELLSISLSKQQQSSYWGADILSDEQQKYAAADVLYLHSIRDQLNEILHREKRKELATNCFNFLQTRVKLDVEGWLNIDIFEH